MCTASPADLPSQLNLTLARCPPALPAATPPCGTTWSTPTTWPGSTPPPSWPPVGAPECGQGTGKSTNGRRGGRRTGWVWMVSTDLARVGPLVDLCAGARGVSQHGAAQGAWAALKGSQAARWGTLRACKSPLQGLPAVNVVTVGNGNLCFVPRCTASRWTRTRATHMQKPYRRLGAWATELHVRRSQGHCPARSRTRRLRFSVRPCHPVPHLHCKDISNVQRPSLSHCALTLS